MIVDHLLQNFRQDAHLAASVRNFLEELVVSSSLVASEQKLASNILKTLIKVNVQLSKPGVQISSQSCRNVNT